jgi:hypothetical protein
LERQTHLHTRLERQTHLHADDDVGSTRGLRRRGRTWPSAGPTGGAGFAAPAGMTCAQEGRREGEERKREERRWL